MKKIAIIVSALIAAVFLAVAASADVWYIEPGPHFVFVGMNGVTYTDTEGNEIHADLPFGTQIIIESVDGNNYSYPDNWNVKIPTDDGGEIEGIISNDEYQKNLYESDDWLEPEDVPGEYVGRVKAMVISEGSVRQKRGPGEFFSANMYWDEIPRWWTVEYEYVCGGWCYAEFYNQYGNLQSGWLRLSDLGPVAETEPPETDPPAPEPTPDPIPLPDPDPIPDPVPETTSAPVTEPAGTEEQTDAALPEETESASAGTGESGSETEKPDEPEKKTGKSSPNKVVIRCAVAAVIVSITALVIILIVVKKGRKPSGGKK